MGFLDFLSEQPQGRQSNKSQKQWLDAFVAIYKDSTPLIDEVTKVNTGGRPDDVQAMLGARQSFPYIMQRLKSLPQPPQSELRHIRSDFQATLQRCIQAGEMAAKMLDDQAAGSNTAARIHFGAAIGAAGQAGIYHKSLLRRLKKAGSTDHG